MCAVAVGTMSLVVVLSVFNGLEDLIRSLYSSFDAEIKVTASVGKSFIMSDSLLQKIKAAEGVGIITEVVEDNALLKYKETQMVVKMKGVSDNFIEQQRMDSAIVYGQLKLKENNINYAIIGRGVQDALSIAPASNFYALQVFYPKNLKGATLDPSKAVNRKSIMPGAVFAIEKQYDENYIFVPLEFALELTEYGNKRTSLEIKTAQGKSMRQVKKNLQQALGNDFLVLDSDEQHSSLLKAIKIEKLFVFITFSFILAVASFNIFFSLSMLAIEKQKDIAVLYAMGATKQIIRKIFLSIGGIIAFIGAATGLFLGFILCYLQEVYELVPMGMQTSVLYAYPVKMQAGDFVLTGASIIIITFLASYRPAVIATKNDPLSNL